MRTVLLTGGTASGKTEAANIFREAGHKVVSADEIARQLETTDSHVLKNVRICFGGEVFFPDGTLNRRALARRVFYDRAALEKLNGIVHPEVHKRVIEELHAAAKSGEKMIFIEDPLLYFARHIKGHKHGAETVVVFLDSALENRAKRLESKGMSYPEILARIGSAPAEWEYRAAADRILSNNSTLEELKTNVLELLETLTVNG